MLRQLAHQRRGYRLAGVPGDDQRPVAQGTLQPVDEVDLTGRVLQQLQLVKPQLGGAGDRLESARPPFARCSGIGVVLIVWLSLTETRGRASHMP